MHAYLLPSIITLLICMLHLATSINVGRARTRYGVQAPAVSGHAMFERAYRVQMNTLETTLMTLPAMWICAVYFSGNVAALLGALWLVTRVWYALSYQRDPATRGPAFGCGIACFAALWLTAAYGIAGSF